MGGRHEAGHDSGGGSLALADPRPEGSDNARPSAPNPSWRIWSAIHACKLLISLKSWVAGTRPAMTAEGDHWHWRTRDPKVPTMLGRQPRTRHGGLGPPSTPVSC